MTLLDKIEQSEINDEFLDKIKEEYTYEEIEGFITEYIDTINERNDLTTSEKQEILKKIASFLSNFDIKGSFNYDRLRPTRTEPESGSTPQITFYLNKINCYRMLTAIEEKQVGKDLLLKDKITIFKNKEDKVLDIERVLSSIKTENQKKEVFKILNKHYHHPYIVSSGESNFVLDVLSKYNQLEKYLGHIPSKDELQKYFYDYPGISFLDNKKELDEDQLLQQLKIFSTYQLARMTLFHSNLRLVIRSLKYYHKFTDGEADMDLIMEGNRGLMEAVDGFDIRKGVRFSTYATYRINSRISKYMERDKLIYIPAHILSQISQMNHAKEELGEIFEKVSPKQLSRVLQMPERKIQQLEQQELTPISLETPIGWDSDQMILDTIASGEETAEERMLRVSGYRSLREVITGLNKKYQYIIARRYGFIDGTPATLQEIGDEFGVSKQRIKQIESRAFNQMKPKVIKKVLG